MKRHLPTIERFEKAFKDADFKKLRSLYIELHSIAGALAEAEVGSKPKELTDYSKPDPTTRDENIPPVYAITHGGLLWQWNCGWRQFDPIKKRHFGPTLGHIAFRRKPLCHQKQRDWVYKPRPYGPWRRLVECRMFHPIAKANCSILCTDGIKAIVRFDDGSTTDVFYSNLTEISTPMKSKLKKDPKTATEKTTPKRATITKKSLLDLL